MNYIYDVLLNFKEEMYDFFDWNSNDNVLHIRKIPIIRISSDDLYNIKNNIVEFDNQFLQKYKNKTEFFCSKNIKNLECAFILSDGNYAFGISIRDKKTKKSELLVDEEVEIIDICKNLICSKIVYKIIKNSDINELKTRRDIEIERYIKKEIRRNINNIDKLKYIYYECFDKKENDKNKILYKINEELTNNNQETKIKIYKFFKLIQVNK